MNAPKITIITIAFNEVDVIEKTLQSVINQTYTEIEYLVIDGKSTDGTVELIQKYQDKIDYFVSEKDGGIYDAMNKGIAMAQGEWINFMNAGDWFIHEDVVRQVVEKAPQDADMIYGDHEVRLQTFIKEKKALPTDQLWKKMIFSHQSLFARTALLQAHPFNKEYGSAADYHFIYHRYLSGAKFFNTGIKIASFAGGGVSDSKVIQSYKLTWRIVREMDKSLKVNIFYLLLIDKQYIIVSLRGLLPNDIFEKLMKVKNAVN